MNYTHLPSISCYYSERPIPSHTDAEAHFEYEMLLITEGEATFFINHKSYQIREKCLVFVNRLDRHSLIVTKEPYKRYVTTISSDLIMANIKEMELISIFIQRPKNFQHVIPLDTTTYHALLPLFQNLQKEYSSRLPFYVSKSMTCVISILIDLYRTCPQYFPAQTGNISSAVVHVQKYVNDHYDEKITLHEIANKLFINKHALSLAFKEIVGISFKEYLVLFRLTEAKKLLPSSDLSISDIAEKVGYVNVNNFIRIFKEKENITPLQFRKQSGYLI